MKLWITSKATKIYRLHMGRCNVYLLARDGHYILVDTSVLMERSYIEKKLEKLRIRHLDAIILTHGHTDHAANADYFSKKYCCNVFIHPSEEKLVRDGITVAPDGKTLFAKLVSIIAKKTKACSTFEPVEKSKIIPFELEDRKNAYRKVKVQQIGAYQEFDLVLMETPGHTKGSVTVIVDHEIAMVGDACVHNVVGNIFPPFADLTREEVVRTWEVLLKERLKLYCPAHGKEIRRQLLLESYSVYKKKGEES